MNNLRILIIAVILIIGIISLCIGYKKIKTLFMKCCLTLLVCGTFFLCGTLVNVSTLSKEDQKRLNKAIEKCGDDYIDTKGDKIYININGRLIDVNEVKVINTWSKNYTVSIDGEEIELDSPGVKNTVRTLHDLGIMK